MATQIPISILQQFTVPTGGIILWSGSEASVPSGWALCNGTNGTPDLRGRFVLGSSPTYAQGTTGGSATKTLTVANMPAHSHSGTTSTTGSHTHDVNIANDNTGGSFRSFGNMQFDNREMIATSAAGNHAHTFTTNNTGSGTAFDIMPPYYALAYIMKL